jgi:hypothetical protein
MNYQKQDLVRYRLEKSLITLNEAKSFINKIKELIEE